MRTFEKTYVIANTVEAVYAAWVSEATVIPPASALQIDPQPGGIYRLVMGNDLAMNGTFSMVVPGKRLVYSWRWDGEDEITQVDVTFRAMPDGTHVCISHSDFASDASLENHRLGWDSYVAGLGTYLLANA